MVAVPAGDRRKRIPAGVTARFIDTPQALIPCHFPGVGRALRMFTGIVQAMGEVAGLEPRGNGAVRLALDLPGDWAPLELGESIAVNGCCLTVAGGEGARAQFDVLEESLRLTNLGALEAGSKTNLERALRVGDRLGGHFVMGHIDTRAAVLALDPEGDDFRLEVALPAEFQSLVAYKGSVAVDGISLTVARAEPDRFTAFITPPHDAGQRPWAHCRKAGR